MNLRQTNSAYMFSQLSKIMMSDENLLAFYEIKDNQKWNDLEAIKKKSTIIALLKKLACQQQELLKCSDISLSDISFDSVKHLDILKDNGMINIYVNSRILYNQRELLSKASKSIDLTMALRYIDSLNCRVVAILRDTDHCVPQLLPAMKKKDFWENRSVITTDGISYFPTFTGTNILLATEMVKKSNIVVALP